MPLVVEIEQRPPRGVTSLRIRTQLELEGACRRIDESTIHEVQVGATDAVRPRSSPICRWEKNEVRVLGLLGISVLGSRHCASRLAPKRLASSCRLEQFRTTARFVTGQRCYQSIGIASVLLRPEGRDRDIALRVPSSERDANTSPPAEASVTPTRGGFQVRCTGQSPTSASCSA